VTVFVISTYTIKPDKLAEHTSWGKKLVKTIKEKPDQFKEVNSLKVCHRRGNQTGNYLAMWEFKTSADRKAWEQRFRKEQLATSSEFMQLIVPGSFKRKVWKPVKIIRRKDKHQTQKH
jgi:antibiotic biosynthesis monooxygenase (ABM) superfamily enzyme